MATGIFPEPIAGGVVYRGANGLPTYPNDVQNAFSPSPTFISTCELTALPADCTARIEPRQINALVSELISFAECLDPNGPWNCSALNNLCAAFAAWKNLNLQFVIISDTPPQNVVDKQLWWESDSGYMFIMYNDGNSRQWVQIANGAGSDTSSGGLITDGATIVGEGVVGDPYRVGTLDCGVW